MGSGNCCVFGSHEGLYFIDNDDFHVYCRRNVVCSDKATKVLAKLQARRGLLLTLGAYFWGPTVYSG